MSYDMPSAYWKVTKVVDHGKEQWYRYHVEGTNLANEVPAFFSWAVPDLEDPRFDLSEAIFELDSK